MYEFIKSASACLSYHFRAKQMALKVIFVSVLLAFVVGVFSEDDEVARLLVKKSVLNNVLVENKELTVEYTIYNVGSGFADLTSVFSSIII